MLRGMKRAIDVERGIDETSELTVGELRSMATDRAARLAALRRRWEATVDLHTLIGALIFEQARLPEWLFRGLVQKLNEQFNNPYVTRFLAVRRTHDVLGMTMDEAYIGLRKTSTIPRRAVAMIPKIRPQVAKIDRIQRRPRARRRRS